MLALAEFLPENLLRENMYMVASSGRGKSMGEEKVRKGRSVALSGVIGFVLVALLIGMIVGVALSFFVIAPMFYGANMGNNGNQNTNTQNGNNNYGPTTNPNNNQNGYNQGPTGNPDYNNQNGNNTNDNGNQNNGGGQGMTNNNPPITNPTGQYSGTGKQFSVSIPDQNGGQASGTISADITCVVQQSGNNIQLDLTITPTSIPQSLSQAISGNSAVTLNFAGTTSGSQINAQASGTTGSGGNNAGFNLSLNGSLSSNTLTITVTSTNSQLSINTQQPITLQSS